MTVVIPAGASDKELIITIERLTYTKDLLSDRQVLISPVYEILKNVTNNFTKAVTLTFVFGGRFEEGAATSCILL